MNHLITGPYAHALQANRASFNARFAEARRTQPRLDADEFLDTLRTTLGPIVAAVDLARPERTPDVLNILYDLALDLHAREFIGPHSRYPYISQGWRDLLPALGAHLAQSPRAVAGSITNALYNLSVEPSARPQQWLESVRMLAPLADDVPTLLQVGQVAAWRAGLAHYRRGALALCRFLPSPLAFGALGLVHHSIAAAAGLPVPRDEPASLTPAALNAMLDRLAADPWLHPAGAAQPPAPRALKLVARAGAFRGFGGLFMAPPFVTAAGEHFLARDGDARWLLTADVFGATFHRAGDIPAQTGSGAFQLDRSGRVSLRQPQGTLSAVFPELANFTSAAGNDRTLAVTTALSHAIYLVALA